MKLLGTLPVARVTRESVHDRVYAELRSSLMRGLFLPGQAITMQELADAFGTSTQPVREALRRLVGEKALDVLPNRSVTVPLITVAQLDDIMRVRLEIEGAATAWAAERIGKAAIQRLERLCRDMGRKVERGDTQDYLAQNQEFRFTIYEAAASPTVMPIIESLWLQIGPYKNLLQEPGRIRVTNDHHQAALAALQRRDAAAARAAICADMRAGSAVMRAHIAAEAQGEAQGEALGPAAGRDRAPHLRQAAKADA